MHALPWIIAGLAWPLLLTGPPPSWLWPSLATFVLGALPLGVFERRWRRPGLALVLAAWSAWHIDRGLALRLDRTFDTTVIEGVVTSLPSPRGDGLQFRFQVRQGPWGSSPRTLDVRWFQPGEVPRAGERWRLPLRIRPPRSRVNFSGGDAERYWFAQRVHGLAVVQGQGARIRRPTGSGLNRWREQVRDRIEGELAGLPGSGLVLALGLGDRSRLSDGLQEAMRGTGTGHLLAISGLHVGLVGLFGFWVGRGLLLAFLLTGCWRGVRWPPQRGALLIGVVAATGYALLAGFGTSPRRALIMSAVVAIALLLRRRLNPWQCWGVALGAVWAVDPLAPLGAGFWLSFGAVAVLLHQFSGRLPPARGGRALLRAQLGIGLALLPLGVAWFQWISVSAFGVNLLAIPFVSFVLLPLVLLTLALLALDGLFPDLAPLASTASMVAHMATGAADVLERSLVALDHAGRDLAGWAPSASTPVIAFALAGGALLLLPRGLRLRRFGALLLAPLVLSSLPGTGAHGPAPGAVQLELLDVGQGQATLVSTRSHAMLVDTGPGQPGAWDLVDAVVLPALADARSGRPDLLLVSHGDLDHAGGLGGLRGAFPGLPVMGNARRRPRGMTPCHDRRAWAWDGVTFRVLHPSPWLPYRGNDSSCVLQVTGAGGSILLPGDVGTLVERRLAREAPPERGTRLLLSPHHGSRSSSSPELLDWARPDAIALAVGHDNRFDLPHPEVLARYAHRAIPVVSTAGCGALRFTLHRDGRLESFAARKVRRGFWRFPADPDCPVMR